MPSVAYSPRYRKVAVLISCRQGDRAWNHIFATRIQVDVQSYKKCSLSVSNGHDKVHIRQSTLSVNVDIIASAPSIDRTLSFSPMAFALVPGLSFYFILLDVGIAPRQCKDRREKSTTYSLAGEQWVGKGEAGNDNTPLYGFAQNHGHFDGTESPIQVRGALLH